MSEEQETEAFVEEPNKKGALKEEYELPSICSVVLTDNLLGFFPVVLLQLEDIIPRMLLCLS